MYTDSIISATNFNLTQLFTELYKHVRLLMCYRTPDSTPEHRLGAFGRPIKRTAQSLQVPSIQHEYSSTSSSSVTTSSSATDDSNSDEDPRTDVFISER